MTITTMDGLVSGLTGSGAQVLNFFRAAGTNQQAAQGLMSLWSVGGAPGAGATPPTGVGEAPTKSTAGALPLTNPGSGSMYLAGLEFVAWINGQTLLLYDRLVHASGLNVTSTGTQTINSAAITRPDANGVGAEAFIEIYTSIGVGTSTTATISYTNSAGTASRSGTATIGGSAKAGALIPFQLASGDFGVKSIQTLTLSQSMTSGAAGVTIGRRIAAMPGSSAGAAASGTADPMTLGLAGIDASACLWLVLFIQTNTTATTTTGIVRIANG